MKTSEQKPSPQKMRKNITIAALIPAREEGKFIKEVVRRARPHVDKVFVVDDGSPDQTAAEALKAGAEVISHPFSRGKGHALQTGLTRLSGNFDYVIMLDGDLQHVPEEIANFVEHIRQTNAPLIIGCRSFKDRTMPISRRLTNRTMSTLISVICRQSIADTQSGFRALRCDIVDLLLQNCRTGGFDFETEMLLVVCRRGYSVSTIPISTCYGSEISKIRPIPDTIHFLRLILPHLLPEASETALKRRNHTALKRLFSFPLNATSFARATVTGVVLTLLAGATATHAYRVSRGNLLKANSPSSASHGLQTTKKAEQVISSPRSA